MTVLGGVTRVRATTDGSLTAECRSCGVLLEQLDGADVARALAAFDRCHPAAPLAGHARQVPAGWRTSRRDAGAPDRDRWTDDPCPG